MNKRNYKHLIYWKIVKNQRNLYVKYDFNLNVLDANKEKKKTKK